MFDIERVRNFRSASKVGKTNSDLEEVKTKDPKFLSGIISQTLVDSLRVTPEHFRGEREGKISDIYESLEILSKGNYGEIRKVKHKLNNEIRVVKTISKTRCQMTSSFSDEIQILQKLVIYFNK